MIVVRPARHGDAVAIGAVHVAAWRSAYPGLLPDAYLAGLSPIRQAGYYAAQIARGAPVLVAASDDRSGPRIVGFATAGPGRTSGLGDGEVETLYVLDDWRDRGVGTGLLRAAAGALAGLRCRSAYCWVLRDNPSRWFYRHLGGREAAESETRVAGRVLPQLAYRWDPIERLMAASPAG